MGYLELAKKVAAKKVAASVVQPILHTILHEIFDGVLRDLGRREDMGLLCFGPKDPNLLAAERQVLADVDTTWTACLKGDAKVEDFRKVVGVWQDSVIKLYSPVHRER